MIILLYFDWCGSRKELKDWCNRVSEACGEIGINYMGLYGSMNEKWNHVSLFETNSYDDFLKMGGKVKRPPCMPHYITEILVQQNLM